MIKYRKSALALVITSVMGLTACGGSSSSSPAPTPAPAPAPAPAPTNSAPTDITLSAMSLDENAAGSQVGTLSATDADSGDTHTFTVSDDRFEVVDGALKLKADESIDFEKSAEVTVTVTATDSADATFDKEFTITVNDALDFYEFKNTNSNESSVAYSGQTARHLLINDLKKVMSSQFGGVNETSFATRELALAALNKYYDVGDNYDDLHGANNLLTTTTPESLQTVLTEVSGSKKDLLGKIAGSDEKGQHKDWDGSETGTKAFVGWGAAETLSPDELVRQWFGELADNTQTAIDGTKRFAVDGTTEIPVYVTEDGRDLLQLVQKFLLMSVGFSQGADDYMDNDIEGPGLNDTNMREADSAYSNLEHKWDEGFGYFGAARNFLDYSDDEIAAKGGRDGWASGYNDFSGDGKIDFESEFNFGQSTNAAKRDRGTQNDANPTDFTTDAMMGFLNGRQLIATAANEGRELSDDEKATLWGYRNDAVNAWEKSISATVVHYINDTRADLERLINGDAEFSFTDLAKHWSEMKGFALGFQFNPHSPVTDAQFVQLHELMGDKPVITDNAEIEAYREKLLQARKILQDAYGFDDDHVADW